MAYRCSQCNRFTSVELLEPDVDVDVDEEGIVTVSAELELACQNCGDVVATCSTDESEAADLRCPESCENPVYSIVDSETTVEASDRFDGKPGTPSRYRRHFYQAIVSVVVECACGEKSDPVEIVLEAQASSFEATY